MGLRAAGLLAAVVLLVGAGVVAATDRPGPATARTAEPVVLGRAAPAQAQERAAAVAEQTPGIRYTALAELASPLTVEQTGRLVAASPTTVARAYVRAPVAGAELLAVEPGDDVVRTLTALLPATAARRADQERDLRALSRDEDARLAAREAAAYGGDCACVLALLVEGRAADLAALQALPGVAGVEVAPRGTRPTGVEVDL